MDDIVQEFLVESTENLDQLDQDLVALESNPEDRQLIASAFRTIHTIKGASGFLAFSTLERLTHVGENLLADLRSGKLAMNQSTTNVLLRMVDTVRTILANIERTGGEGAVEIDPLIADIISAQSGQSPAEVKPPEGHAASDSVDEHVDANAPAPKKTPKIVARRRKPAGTNDAQPTNADAPTPPAPAAIPAENPQPSEHPDGTAPRSAGDSTVRVDVNLLDDLMRQVGELVLARNQITRLASDANSIEMLRSAQRLNLIAGELQAGVMKTRMQPIDHIWSKMPRVVRDLAAQCGKQVRLELTGGDTELDRSLLEAVKDPLTHLVRNAVDHGIERPDERTAAGKSPSGTLTLAAYHSGGQVVVDVRDDGKGIDPAVIAAKAVAKGLVTQEQASAMSDRDVLNLLFLPGFSTAEKVTNVSGRGVGMDVVRTRIEGIGGTVDVESTAQVGTVWRMRIPLTLAIMPAILVDVDGGQYAIPQVNVVELVSVQAEQIERMHAAPVFRLRGDLLPLVPLRAALGRPEGENVECVIAVVQSDQHRFGLIVDDVRNSDEVVVKPLSVHLKAVGLYGGATILGDGRIALILDVQAIARRAFGSASDLRGDGPLPSSSSAARQTQRVLVAKVAGRRIGLPMDGVSRLEPFVNVQLERIGDREVIQYRNSMVRVGRVDRFLGSHSTDDASTERMLVVYTADGRHVALLLDQIIDIVDDDINERQPSEAHGLAAASVIDGAVTEVLDVHAALLAADPQFPITHLTDREAVA